MSKGEIIRQFRGVQTGPLNLKQADSAISKCGTTVILSLFKVYAVKGETYRTVCACVTEINRNWVNRNPLLKFQNTLNTRHSIIIKSEPRIAELNQQKMPMRSRTPNPNLLPWLQTPTAAKR